MGSLHRCALFFISGYFVRPGSGYLAWRRFVFIFIPYVIWCTVAGLLYAHDLEEIRSLDFWNHVYGLVPPYFMSPINGPLWFLAVLMVTSLFNPILYRIKTIFLLISAGILLFLSEEHISPLAANHKILTGVAFYFLGIVSARSKNIFTEIQTIALPLFLILALYGICETFRDFNEMNMNHPMGLMLGVLFYISLAFVLKQLCPTFVDRVAQYGECAFFIYCTHFFIIKFFSPLLAQAQLQSFTASIVYTAFPVTLTASLIVLYQMGKKYIPSFMPYLTMTKVRQKTTPHV